MRAKDRQEDRDALHITNQRRMKVGMAYDLKCSGQRLTVTVIPRSSVDDADEWCAEAQVTRPPETPVVFTQWGPTRLDAVQAVGRAWTSAVPDHGLEMFDWEAVAKMLATVRAV